MNTQILHNRFKKYGLVFAMLFSFVLFGEIGVRAQEPTTPQSPPTVPLPPTEPLPPVTIPTSPIEPQDGIRAQDQDKRDMDKLDKNLALDNRYDTNDSLMYRSAVEYGQRDGMSQGRNDARRNRTSNSQGAKHYRNASRGYNSRNGTRPAYQGAYRDGFTRGYDEAFGNDANRPKKRGN